MIHSKTTLEFKQNLVYLVLLINISKIYNKLVFIYLLDNLIRMFVIINPSHKLHLLVVWATGLN